MQFSGVTTTTPVDVAATTHDTNSSAWTQATAPSVTTTMAYDEIVVLFASGGQQFFATGTYHSTGSDPIKNYYTGRSTNTTSAGGSEYAYESDSAGSASTSVQSAYRGDEHLHPDSDGCQQLLCLGLGHHRPTAVTTRRSNSMHNHRVVVAETTRRIEHLPKLASMLVFRSLR